MLVLGLHQEVFAWSPQTNRYRQLTAEDGRVVAMVASPERRHLLYVTAEKLVRNPKGPPALRGVVMHVLMLPLMTVGKPIPIAGDVTRLVLAPAPAGFAIAIEGDRVNGNFSQASDGGPMVPARPLDERHRKQGVVLTATASRPARRARRALSEGCHLTARASKNAQGIPSIEIVPAGKRAIGSPNAPPRRRLCVRDSGPVSTAFPFPERALQSSRSIHHGHLSRHRRRRIHRLLDRHALVARGDACASSTTSPRAAREHRRLRGDVELIEGSSSTRRPLGRAVEGVDYVFHQAAIPSVPRSWRSRSATRANVTGTLRRARRARSKAGVKRVVFAASSAAYGETPTLPKVETMPPAPLSPYAATKLAGEHYCQVYARRLRPRDGGLRYFNVFGPRQDPKSQYAAVIPNFITAALARQAAAHLRRRQAVARLLLHRERRRGEPQAATADARAPGEVFNIACGEPTDAQPGGRAHRRHRRQARSSPSTRRRARATSSTRCRHPASRASARLHGACQFAEGLERTIAWYKDAESRAMPSR